jgi:hypothetical protein
MKNKRMSKILLFVAIAFIAVNQLSAQVYTNKEVGKKNQQIADSLKKAEYPYILPIWGQKVTQKGYLLPYSAGLSVNYFGQKSDLIIDNLLVGFNNGPQYNLDEIVRFDKAVATANSINLRPDIWVFPFLNVYGIFGKAKTSTEIGAGLWLPDTSNTWHEITSFSTKANFEATTMGVGITPTIGVGGGWLAIDMNMAWTDISALEKPAFTFVFGPRLGKSFKLKKENSNIAIWVGGFRVKLASETSGSLNLAELFPLDELQIKVDNGFVKVADAQVQVDNWWESLSTTEQKNPVNKAKYETANRTITAAANVLTSVDGALNDEKETTVQYSLAKRPKDMWNFIIGSQYQMNRHFMLRVEYGFLASRQQLTMGLQYRFGL